MSPGAVSARAPRPAFRRRRRAGLVALLIVLAFIASSLLIAPVRTAERTALLLPSFFVQWPINPAGWFVPAIEQATIDVSGPPADGEPGGGTLHIVRPGSGRHPALLISLGAEPAPPDNPAVVRLMRGLAQSGIVAVLVESPALNGGYITPQAPPLLVSAYQTMAGQRYVEPGHIGFLGLSVGGSLELIAAADPRISGQVRLVEAFGSYNSLAAEIRAAVTHSFELNGQEEAWQPDPTTVRVARLNVIRLLAPDDQAQLTSLLDSGASLSSQPPASLSPGGVLAYRLLTASDPAQWNAIYATLPADARAQIEALSPSAYLDQIRAPVFLMVDRDDPYIPYVQSVQMNQALRAAGHPPYFSEFSIFRHVEPTRGASLLVLLRDIGRLLVHVDAVLSRLF
jgi:acetyl esterase/lipase